MMETMNQIIVDGQLGNNKQTTEVMTLILK